MGGIHQYGCRREGEAENGGPTSVFNELLWKIQSTVTALSSREEGQSMVEYGIIVALIAVVVIALLVTMGNTLANVFSNITASL
jgi:pilus assembly protein Flp/PilA